MRNVKIHIIKSSILVPLFLALKLASFGQSGVTANDLAIWTSNNTSLLAGPASSQAGLTRVLSFKYTGEQQGAYTFECSISQIENLKSLVLEGNNGVLYNAITSIENFDGMTGTAAVTLNTRSLSDQDYRIRLVSRDNEVFYSNAIQAGTRRTVVESRLWPNPAIDKLNIEIYTEVDNAAHYMIQDIGGSISKQGEMRLKQGKSSVSLNIDYLTAGVYQLTISQTKVDQPISLLFVKQ